MEQDSEEIKKQKQTQSNTASMTRYDLIKRISFQ